MKKLLKPLSRALLAGCAFLALPALAANASALADLTSFRYQLIDLDLNDGVSPAVSIQDDHVTGYASISIPGFQDFDSRSGQGQAQAAHGSGSSLTDVSASSQRSEIVFQANPGAGNASSQTLNYFTFELTRNTAIRFDIEGTLAAEPGFGAATASGYVQGWFYSRANGVTERPAFYHTQSLTDGNHDFALGADYATGNYTGGGTLYYGVSTYLSFAAAPVPEPATWGMLGLGLMVLGRRLRRRQARR